MAHGEQDASGTVVGSCPTYLGGGLSAPLRAGTGDPIYDEPAVNASNDDY